MTSAAPHTPEPPLPDEATTEQVLLRLSADAGPARSVSPMDAAQALVEGPSWQRALPQVRRVAVRLAQEGRLLIYRKGKPVDPSDFRGVWRFGPPRDE